MVPRSGKRNSLFLIDTDTYQTPFLDLSPVWSPDGKWIVYNKVLKNHLRAVLVYSLDNGKASQITDGLSDADYAEWDRNGKYLYFTASTKDRGLSTSWLDMSSIDRKVTRSVYVVVLRKEDPSPLAPESDDEKPADTTKKEEKDKDKDKDKEAVSVRIDFDNIDQRILALPIAERDYLGLFAGKTGILYLIEARDVTDAFRDRPALTVQKFDLETRKTEKVVEGVKSFDLSHDREKIALCAGRQMVHRAVGCSAQAWRGRAQDRRHGNAGRSQGGMAPDLSRNLAY